MPTINRLVRNESKQHSYKSKAPALGKKWDSLNKKEKKISSPQEKDVCQDLHIRINVSNMCLILN